MKSIFQKFRRIMEWLCFKNRVSVSTPKEMRPKAVGSALDEQIVRVSAPKEMRPKAVSSRIDRVIGLLREAGNGGLRIEEAAERLSQQERKTVTEKQARSAIDGARARDDVPIYNVAVNTFTYLPEEGSWK